MNEPIVIVGAGIGGLSAALSLAAKGFEVDVFEEAPELSEVGAGIQLSPNCTRILHRLGLGDALRKCAFVPEAVEVRHWRHGRTIVSTPLGATVQARYGYPYYHVHRADLLDVLTDAARASPNIRVHLDSPVESVVQEGDRAAAVVRGVAHRGSVVVGADGIRSVVRTSMFETHTDAGLAASAPTPDSGRRSTRGGAANETGKRAEQAPPRLAQDAHAGVPGRHGSALHEPPRFTGTMAWRSLVAVRDLPRNASGDALIHPVAGFWWGPGKHFVHYYVRGGEAVNCVGVVERSDWLSESWTELGSHDELKADFAGWHPDLQALMDAMDPAACYKWALFDRSPMTPWRQGRVTLLGDACHASLPFLAQGAAMAIEDGAVLAQMLASARDGEVSLDDALDSYERIRRPRTTRVQETSRRNSRIYHMRGTQAWIRNLLARRAASNTLDWLFDYDAEGDADAEGGARANATGARP